MRIRRLPALMLLLACALASAQGAPEGRLAPPPAPGFESARLALRACDLALDLPPDRLAGLRRWRDELESLAPEVRAGDEAARTAFFALIAKAEDVLTPAQWASVSAEVALRPAKARLPAWALSAFGPAPAPEPAVELDGAARASDDSGRGASVSLALKSVSSKYRHKRVKVKGLGLVDLGAGLSALKRVQPVERAGLSALEDSRQPGTLYVDQALLDSKALKGALAHGVALLAFKAAADGKGLAWTPGLERQAHGKALALAGQVMPSLAGAVSRALDAAKPRRYRFDTGVEIVASGGPRSKLYVSGPAGEPRLLGEGPVTLFPVSGRRPGRNEYAPDAERESQLLVQLRDEAWIVAGDGRAFELPLRTSSLARASNGSFPVAVSRAFHHGGQAHRLYSFQGRGNKRSDVGGKGQTFLVREDGVVVRVDNRYRAFGAYLFDFDPLGRQPSAKDGMLALSGARRIDLDHLEAEARFDPRPPRPVVDAEGAAIRDPLRYVESRFGDIGEEMRRNPGGAFDLIGDPEEVALITRMRESLIKPELGSAVLLGPAGVAKTQTVRSFIAAAKRGEFKEIPRTTRFFNVDAATFGQGSKYFGADESKIKALIEACAQAPCVLFMDEIHSLRGQGAHAQNSNDLFQHLKTAMADGSIKIIGTSTDDEFYAAFGGDLALLRRFGIIRKPEPGPERVLKTAQSWIKRFRKKTVAEDVLRLVVRLSSDYDTMGAQPSKATKLLSHAFAQVEVAGRGEAGLTQASVLKAAADLYGVAPEMFDAAKTRERIRRLPALLDEKVPGQAWVKSALVELERQRVAAAQDPARPAVSVMIAGRSDPDLSVAFGEATGRTVHHVEMSRYAPGGLGPEDFRRELARAVQKDAFSVLLLERFEQADPAVQLAALAILDSGETYVQERLNSSSDGGGASVRYSFRNAAVLMTTDAGKELVQRRAASSAGRKDDWSELGPEVEKGGVFGAVLARVQALVASIPARTRAQLKTLARAHLDRILAEQTSRQGRTVRMANPDQFVDFLAALHGEEGAGQAIVRDIARFVRSAVADAVLSGEAGSAGAVTIRFDRARFEKSL